MDFSSSKMNPLISVIQSHLSPIILTCFLIFISSHMNSSTAAVPNHVDNHYSNLIYKACKPQTFSPADHDHHFQPLISSFFEDLLAQSSQSKFFKSTAGDESAAVSGLFQCRGDLTNNDCHTCITTLSHHLSNSSCTKSPSARIHLLGCYAAYETEGSIRVNDDEDDDDDGSMLVHKTCNGGTASEFEEMIDGGFAAMESEISLKMVSDDDGFYSVDYQLVRVVAQCQGDLLRRVCDCSECVSKAAQIAREECGSSVSGQVYLNKCFVGYTYYPYGIPPDGDQTKKGANARKSVAIVLGGAAALIFGFIVFLFIKNLGKKDDD